MTEKIYFCISLYIILFFLFLCFCKKVLHSTRRPLIVKLSVLWSLYLNNWHTFHSTQTSAWSGWILCNTSLQSEGFDFLSDHQFHLTTWLVEGEYVVKSCVLLPVYSKVMIMGQTLWVTMHFADATVQAALLFHSSHSMHCTVEHTNLLLAS